MTDEKPTPLYLSKPEDTTLPVQLANALEAADKLRGDLLEKSEADRIYMEHLLADAQEMRLQRDEARMVKDGAYRERNQLLALLARMALALGWEVGTGQHPEEDSAWEEDWRTLLFIDLPTGQCSWHFHDSERHLLAGLPVYAGAWDGHTTDAKYERVRTALVELECTFDRGKVRCAQCYFTGLEAPLLERAELDAHLEVCPILLRASSVVRMP